MAISFQQGASNGAANAGPVVVTFDSTPAADDLILVYYADGDTADNAMPAITDYTDVGTSEQYADGSGGDCNSRAYYKYSDGTETQITCPDTGGGSNDGVSAVVMIFRGVASAAQGGPFSTAITKNTGTGSGNADNPSIATASGDVVVLMAAAATASTNIGTFTAPANYTTNAELGTAGPDTIDARAAMAYRTSGYSNPEDPAAWALSGSAAGDSWNAVTLALKEAPAAQTVTGVVLTITPSLPTGSVKHTLTGVVLTATPSLPTGSLKHTLTGTVLTVTPSLPIGSVSDASAQTVTGVVLTITPSLPTGSLRHSLTGVVLTATPSLPSGSLQLALTGVVLTVTPTLPAGSVTESGGGAFWAPGLRGFGQGEVLGYQRWNR